MSQQRVFQPQHEFFPFMCFVVVVALYLKGELLYNGSQVFQLLPHLFHFLTQFLDVILVLLNILHQRQGLLAEVEGRLQHDCTIPFSVVIIARVSAFRA